MILEPNLLAPVAKRRRLGDEHVGSHSKGEREVGCGLSPVSPTPDYNSPNYTQAWQRNALPPSTNYQWQSHQAETGRGTALTDPNPCDGISGGINNLAAPYHLPPQYGTSWQCGYQTTPQFGQCQSASPFSQASSFDHNGMAYQQRNTAWLASEWGQMDVTQPLHGMDSNSTMMSGPMHPSIDPLEIDSMHHAALASLHGGSWPSGVNLTCPPQPVQIMNAESPIHGRLEAETVCFGRVRDSINAQEMHCELD